MTIRIDHILIPTDLSEFGRLAIDYGVLIGERCGAHLTVLYADEVIFPFDLLEQPLGYYLENMPETQRVLQERLREYITENIATPRGAEALIVHDAPSRAITKTAEEMKADLVIMGTHGRRGWRRALLGSVAERVLRDTNRPVLTVRPRIEPDHHAGIRSILCPVNFTPVAHAAVLEAAAFAEAFDAELEVVHVAEGKGRQDEAAAEERFRAWIPSHVATRASYRHVAADGHPAERLLHIAEQDAIDLIVVGAQHRRFYDATVIGTTTERITRFAPCPVLTISRAAVAIEEEEEKEELVGV